MESECIYAAVCAYMHQKNSLDLLHMLYMLTLYKSINGFVCTYIYICILCRHRRASCCFEVSALYGGILDLGGCFFSDTIDWFYVHIQCCSYIQYVCTYVCRSLCTVVCDWMVFIMYIRTV